MEASLWNLAANRMNLRIFNGCAAVSVQRPSLPGVEHGTVELSATLEHQLAQVKSVAESAKGNVQVQFLRAGMKQRKGGRQSSPPNYEAGRRGFAGEGRVHRKGATRAFPAGHPSLKTRR
jgi:RNA-splicing ligase RtcB